ncbi:MAG: biotin/lipoyl-binding protein [Synergistaceae bacterium]|jgi:glutaconyl-CoA decarboxylase|nr:biotin/lipoyl-binding protein [Synergistaceae bacterium]
MSLKYKVTVDGTAYTVEVEELGGSAAAPVSSPAFTPVARVAPAPVAAPVAAPAPAPAPTPAAAPVAAGATTIEAPMPGKILDVKVAVGASVNNGDLVLMLEDMKMENEIFAPAAGTVKEVRVRSGDSVNTGDILIVLG